MKIKTILVLRRRNDGEWNLKYKIVDPIFTVPGTRMPCRIDSGLSRTPRYTGKREPSRSTKKKWAETGDNRSLSTEIVP